MRSTILAAALSGLCVGSVTAADLYVAEIVFLNAKGKIDRTNLTSTGKGVPLDECRLRLQVWESEMLPAIQAAIETLKKEGKHTAVSSSCRKQ